MTWVKSLWMLYCSTVDLQKWKQLDSSSVQVDSSVSAFDIVHISRDIAEDMDKVKDWCFSGNFVLFFTFCLFSQEVVVLWSCVTYHTYVAVHLHL